jgi:predicted alpha/beta superfamily hydrolase
MGGVVLAMSVALWGWCPMLAQGQANALDSASRAGQGRPLVEVLKRVEVHAGEQVTLHSKILGEDRTVLVALPANYGWSGQKYPVLYLTDGQWNFAHARTSAEFLSRERLIPEMILIGVTNPDRTRDLYATRADFKRGGRTIPFPKSGNADRFLDFIDKELIPWTQASYRTSSLRVLAGCSAGGNFALHAARVRPGLFPALIVASPWLAWDERKELQALVPFLKSPQARLQTLFLSYADEGPDMKADVESVVAALQARSQASLRWELATYAGETHDTTVLKSYFDGMRMTFTGWSYPRDPRTNALHGTLEDVKVYYAKLGDRLGLAAPPQVIVNELGYQHLRANEPDAALAAFRFNTEHYPESVNAWDSLGEALQKAGKKDEALASYRRALAIARSSHHPNPKFFEGRIAALEQAPRP